MAQTASVPLDFMDSMAAQNILPLWDRYHDLLPNEPHPLDRPMLWRWRDMLPLIERAARDVDMAQAERRVLMLCNPAFDGKPFTTTNLFAGLQILEPGEKARPHRHTPSAMRFILEGGSGATVVDGQDCPMLPGDLILTPSWAWHEHYNDGKGRVVWLDALDMPLAKDLDVVFAEGGRPNAFPETLSAFPDAAFATGGLRPVSDAPATDYSPMFRYPWTATLEGFAATPPGPDGVRRLRYINPVDGGPVIATLDSYAWELAKGQPSATARSTANTVVAVVDGEGVSTIGGEAFSWSKNDVFTVPHWTWASHEAKSETARFFLFTDREVMRRLHFLREETRG